MATQAAGLRVDQAAGVDPRARGGASVDQVATPIVGVDELTPYLTAQHIPAEKATAIAHAFYTANVEAGEITVTQILPEVAVGDADVAAAAAPPTGYQITVGQTVLELPEAVLANTPEALAAIVTLQLRNPVDETTDNAEAIGLKDAEFQAGLADIPGVAAGSVDGLQTAR